MTAVNAIRCTSLEPTPRNFGTKPEAIVCPDLDLSLYVCAIIFDFFFFINILIHVQYQCQYLVDTHNNAPVLGF